ncbi:HAD family hydrolase [Cuniculiplasma sp. SKW3]|uniref:HAD family hydrolase n=1 Tax=Cuniculiplasma sp. SKW3 TaxID=3400170 RepID=UPI003FD4BC76
MLKSILLDFDNTLYDDLGGIRNVFIQLRKEYRFFRPIPLDELVSRFYFYDYGMKNMLTVDRMPVNEVNLKRTDLFLQNVGLPLKEDMVREIHERIRCLHIKYGKAIPGSNIFLKKLHGRYRIGIVTNHMGDYQREKITKTGISHLIDFMIPAYDFGFFKPDPEIFQIALEYAKCSPEETIMIGDNWKADILGAIQSSIVPVWVNFKNQPAPDPEFPNILRSFTPVDEAVEKIEQFHRAGLPLIKVE